MKATIKYHPYRSGCMTLPRVAASKKLIGYYSIRALFKSQAMLM